MGVLTALVVVVLAGMVGDTIVKIAKARGAGGKLPAQLDQLRQQVDDQMALLAQHETQLQELQERLDFTERLLTQSREQSRLARGDPSPE